MGVSLAVFILMPTATYRHNPSFPSTDRQFYEWLLRIQVDYMTAVEAKKAITFNIGLQTECDVFGKNLNARTVSRYLNSESRAQVFAGFMGRIMEDAASYSSSEGWSRQDLQSRLDTLQSQIDALTSI